MSPGCAIEAISARQRLLALERARVAMPAGAQALDQRVAARALDRRFAGRIDVGDDDRVRLVEAGAELGEEILQPRDSDAAGRTAMMRPFVAERAACSTAAISTG